MIQLPKFILGICMVILFLSCRSQKPVVGVYDQAEEIEVGFDPERLLTDVHSFKTMKIKRLNIDLKLNEVSDNFNGNLAIYRDSLIVISIVPLFGFEALRIMFTKDSIIIINRVEKTYHTSSFDHYLKKYNIPFGFFDLQAVLTNEAFYYKNGLNNRSYTKEAKINDGYLSYTVVSMMGNKKTTKQQIVAEIQNYNISDVLVDDYGRDVNVYIKYEDFKNYEMNYFPEKIEIDIRENGNKIKLDLRYGQVLFDELINVTFEIPENYSRIYL